MCTGCSPLDISLQQRKLKRAHLGLSARAERGWNPQRRCQRRSSALETAASPSTSAPASQGFCPLHPFDVFDRPSDDHRVRRRSTTLFTHINLSRTIGEECWATQGSQETLGHPSVMNRSQRRSSLGFHNHRRACGRRVSVPKLLPVYRTVVSEACKLSAWSPSSVVGLLSPKTFGADGHWQRPADVENVKDE